MKLTVLFRARSRWLISPAIVVLLLMSCKNEAYIQPGDTLPIAYKKAISLYRNEKFGDAVNAFETVINVGRGTDYGKFGHFYLAESYFADGRYLLAADAYQRFITLYPQADKRETAQYKEAMSYYNLSPRYRVSQNYTHTAIEKFQLFIARYPNSDRVQNAANYVSELRTKLAHKLYHAADLYDRLDQYEAAVIYYGETIEQYPETQWAERALAQQIETYLEYASKSIQSMKAERYQNAIEGYETYLQLFPQGPHREEVEDYVNQARDALAELEPVVADTSQQSSLNEGN